MLLAVSPAARVEEVAAKIDGQAIPLAEIDTPSRPKIVRLHQALTDQAARTLDRLIDRRLQASSEAKSPSPKPVTDEAIRAFRASRPEDFEGPFAPLETRRNPAAERPAIRHYLTRKALEAAQTEARRRLRAGHAIKVWLPDGPELEQPLPDTNGGAGDDTDHGGNAGAAAALGLSAEKGNLSRAAASSRHSCRESTPEPRSEATRHPDRRTAGKNHTGYEGWHKERTPF